MAKIWKIVAIVVIIALLLGGVCVLVGMITGADTERIMNLFNVRYDIDGLRQKFEQTIENAFGMQPLA